jgi:dolichol kinase
MTAEESSVTATLARREALRREMPRKLLHMGVGLGALALLVLTREWALVGALVAIAGNLIWRACDRGGPFFRPDEGWFGGIVLYPCVVLLAILLLPFPRGALVVWGVLAFGDAAATLVGLAFGGPRWPFAPRKTLLGSAACLVFGGLAATILLLLAGSSLASALLLAFAASGLAALAECLPLRIDDNLLVGLGAAAGLILVEVFA